MDPQEQTRQIAQLRREVKALQGALSTLISWLPQSANSPIRIDEAARLLNILNGNETTTRKTGAK